MFHILFLSLVIGLVLPSWHNFVIKCTINKPVIHTQMHMYAHGNPSYGQISRFLRLLHSKIKNKQQETVQSSGWAGNRYKCTAITTQPDPTVVSIHITTASLPRQIGHLPSATTQPIGRGQSRAILAIAADSTQSWCGGSFSDIDSKCKILLWTTTTIGVLTASDSAFLQILHLPFSEHSWLGLFPHDLQNF